MVGLAGSRTYGRSDKRLVPIPPLAATAELKKCMDKILKVDPQPTIEVLYLGKLDIDLTRFGDKHIYRIMLIASKKGITR